MQNQTHDRFAWVLELAPALVTAAVLFICVRAAHPARPRPEYQVIEYTQQGATRTYDATAFPTYAPDGRITFRQPDGRLISLRPADVAVLSADP